MTAAPISAAPSSRPRTALALLVGLPMGGWGKNASIRGYSSPPGTERPKHVASPKT